MTVKLSEEYLDAVTDIAAKSGLPVELLVSLLDLELQFPNLHGYGARPALRRSITEILEIQFAEMTESGKQGQ